MSEDENNIFDNESSEGLESEDILQEDIDDLEDEDEEMLERIRKLREADEVKPMIVRELFDMEKDLTLRTETPSSMIIPLVRMSVLEAASDPNRSESLVRIFMRELDKRMISKDRQGRYEMLVAMRALAANEGDGEEGIEV